MRLIIFLSRSTFLESGFMNSEARKAPNRSCDLRLTSLYWLWLYSELFWPALLRISMFSRSFSRNRGTDCRIFTFCIECRTSIHFMRTNITSLFWDILSFSQMCLIKLSKSNCEFLLNDVNTTSFNKSSTFLAQSLISEW